MSFLRQLRRSREQQRESSVVKYDWLICPSGGRERRGSGHFTSARRVFLKGQRLFARRIEFLPPRRSQFPIQKNVVFLTRSRFLAKSLVIISFSASAGIISAIGVVSFKSRTCFSLQIRRRSALRLILDDHSRPNIFILPAKSLQHLRELGKLVWPGTASKGCNSFNPLLFEDNSSSPNSELGYSVDEYDKDD